MKTAYVAKDGTVCKTEQECKSHEEALDIFESVYNETFKNVPVEQRCQNIRHDFGSERTLHAVSDKHLLAFGKKPRWSEDVPMMVSPHAGIVYLRDDAVCSLFERIAELEKQNCLLEEKVAELTEENRHLDERLCEIAW